MPDGPVLRSSAGQACHSLFYNLAIVYKARPLENFHMRYVIYKGADHHAPLLFFSYLVQYSTMPLVSITGNSRL